MDPQVAAAASGLLPLLSGPPRHARVLGSHRRAAIIGVPTATGQRVVSVLTAQATGVPNGVRLAGPADLTRLAIGTHAMVGDRRVRVGELEVHIVRSWNSSVPVGRAAPSRVRHLSGAAADAESGVPAAATAVLRAALDTPAPDGSSGACSAALVNAVDGLIGLGLGSTPGGDDVLAGVLAGLRATGRGRLAAHVAGRLGGLTARTTALSADLLELSARGHACLEALHVLRMAGGSGTDAAYAVAVGRLLSIGHTSGADLATGLAIGLSVAPADPSSVGDGGAAVSTAFTERQGAR